MYTHICASGLETPMISSPLTCTVVAVPPYYTHQTAWQLQFTTHIKLLLRSYIGAFRTLEQDFEAFDLHCDGFVDIYEMAKVLFTICF